MMLELGVRKGLIPSHFSSLPYKGSKAMLQPSQLNQQWITSNYEAKIYEALKKPIQGNDGLYSLI